MTDPPDCSRIAWLQAVFECHHRALLAYATRVTGGRHDRAEEAVQEAFLRLCRQPPEYFSASPDADGHVRAWLFKVCRGRIIDMQRTDHSPPPSADHWGASSAAIPHDSTDSPAETLVKAEEDSQLRELVENLPTRQRELLHLKIHSGLSYREIAEATGLTVSNVGFLLHQAMSTLRQQYHMGDSAR